MKILMLVLLAIWLVKTLSDILIYKKAIKVGQNGIKFASDKDHGLAVDAKTGNSFLTERPVLRP